MVLHRPIECTALIGTFIEQSCRIHQGSRRVDSTIAKVFEKIGDFVRLGLRRDYKIGDFLRAGARRDYEVALARVLTAVDSGQLRSSDKAPAATRFIDTGVFGPLDGVDWVELHVLAEENKMPLATVGDLMAVLRFAIGKK